ncbi:MAG: hypothetical protein AAGF75_14400 [Cyanobacteria bacterium P01_H01_bin.130]
MNRSNRSKWVAIATGIISLLLGVAYLIIVQILDFRGEMIPAPVDLGWLPGAMPLSWRPAIAALPFPF